MGRFVCLVGLVFVLFCLDILKVYTLVLLLHAKGFFKNIGSIALRDGAGRITDERNGRDLRSQLRKQGATYSNSYSSVI